MENEILNKMVTDVTMCETLVITSSSEFLTPTSNDADVNCKLVEVKNRSGVTIDVRPNRSKSFPLEDGSDRLIVVKKLSDIEVKRNSGSGNVTVHFIFEN